MNNGWRLYFSRTWQFSCLLSPSLLSPAPHFEVASKLHGLTRASGHCLSSVDCASLPHSSSSVVYCVPRSTALGFPDTALAWFWSSSLYFAVCFVGSSADSKCIIPEGPVLGPLFLFCTHFLSDFLQTCNSLLYTLYVGEESQISCLQSKTNHCPQATGICLHLNASQITQALCPKLNSW